MRSRLLLAACAASAFAGAACGGELDVPGDDVPRGGSLEIMRTRIAGFDPEESLTGVGRFFHPPGPMQTTTPAPGSCTWTTPEPEPTPDEVSWRDAGELLTLRSTSTSLELDRFDGPSGQILYLIGSGEPPETLGFETSYDLEIDGAEDEGGVPAATLGGAIAVPPAVGLYAPDFASTPASLARTPLQIGWSGDEGERPVVIKLTIAGSSGSATLACSTDDDGFHEIPENWMTELPSGGGTLSVSRLSRTWTELSPDVWFQGDALLTEGGAVSLP